ncbi:hypothetical protein [Spiroplasma endosymbiont of Tricholauxania praeusta]|uniref:hypothetical protein n=1 Tax=Spiroplasma endosymbiont of Tricholauxania praeusta TaxID=3066296 RepID=UPI0030D39D4D
MATGGCLISSGVAMGINNNFNNAYAVPTIVAGASEIMGDCQKSHKYKLWQPNK